MGTSFRDFAAVFFHLSDCVRFSTCVGLLPVRVFPFFLFLYAPTEPVSRAICRAVFDILFFLGFVLRAFSLE